MTGEYSNENRQSHFDTYRFTHPLALDCLTLLSPVCRISQETYQVTMEPALHPLLHALLQTRSRRLRELGLIITFLFDAPPIPELYVVARPLIEHVLALHRPEAIGACREAIIYFFDLLHETHLLKEDVDGVGLRSEAWAYGCERSHLLWAMHVLGAKIQRVGRQRQQVDMTPGYQRYGLAAHLAFRRVEMYYLQQESRFSDCVRADHLYQCALSLRYFLQFVSVIEKREHIQPTAQEIGLCMKNLVQKWGAFEEKEWPSRVRLHERNIREAFSGTWSRHQGSPSQGDPGGPHERPLGEEPIDTIPEVVWVEPNKPQQVWRTDRARGVSVYMPVSASAMALGECAEDYAIDMLEVPGAGRDRRAAQMAAIRQAQRLHRDVLLFPYATEYVQLHEYAWLYQSFDARPWVEWTPTEQGVIAVLKHWIHLGGELDALLGGHLREGGTLMRRLGEGSGITGGDRRFTLLNGPGSLVVCRSIPLDWSGYRGASEMASDPVSRPVCQQVRLMLPPFLREVLEAYLLTRRRLILHPGCRDQDHLFLRSSDPPAPLTREDVVEFLQAAGAPDAAGLLRRLARSFFALYVSRLGFDPLLAAYVSGTRWRLIGSQSFYRHVDADRLNADYSRMAEAADTLIRAALTGGAGEAQRPASADLSSQASAGPGYGSRIVPHPDALRRFVTLVQDHLLRFEGFTDEVNRIRYFNLYMAYAYVVFQLLSGARPLRDGRFSEALASPHPERMRLADKQSGRYGEVRTLRRRADLNALRWEVEQACRFAHDLPSFQVEVYETMERPLLFFVNWDGKPVAADPREVRRRLDEVPEVGEAFPWPLNVGRHLCETALGEAGADREGKDFGLGHTRRWTEALGRFSVADVPFLESDFARHAAAITTQCGLEILSFRTRSNS